MTTEPTTGCPAHVDVEALLADPFAEIDRCAGRHWYADGLDLSGAPMPWVLSHEGVRATLRDRRLSPRSFVDDMIAHGLSVEVVHQLTPLFRRDGDAHRRHRALLAQAFTPRSVERLRPTARRVSERLAEAVAARAGRCEVVADLAAPLPAEVFVALFGLPVEDRDRLAAWASVIVQAFAPAMTPDQVADVERAAGELKRYCAGIVADRRSMPRDDLTTQLVEVTLDGDRLDDDEILATMSGFVFAGSETTRRQIVELVLAFVDRPELWARLRDDTDLIPVAVEEVLRHRGIVPALSRVAIEAWELADLHLEPGERVLASVRSANHDRTVFADPGHFDIERPNAGDHLTFGWGPHLCLGAGLARLEMQELLSVLTARFDAPVLVDPDQSTAPQMVGPDELELVLPVR